MKNIFKTGGQVSGESFIGRKELIEQLKKKYLTEEGKECKALIGLTRTGKTSLAYKIFEHIPDNTLYIYEDLGEWTTYEELWKDICQNIKSELLDKNIEYSKQLDEKLSCFLEDNLEWNSQNSTIKRIFSLLEKQNIKTILVLDEFDNASKIFEGTHHFELFRMLFSSGNYNISSLIISRRNLHTIEGKTYLSSTFNGIFDPIYLKGFDDNEIEEYYSVFQSNEINLSEEQKKQIEYYAGRSPYLLSIIGHHIIEAAESNKQINIIDIFLNKCNQINNYYRDCIERLKEDGDLKRIIPFIIGPNIGVTRLDKDELINLGYLRYQDNELIAISDYFKIFLSSTELDVNIWDAIISLEKEMKLITESETINIINHFKVYGDTIIAIQRNILYNVKDINDNTISRYEGYIDSNKRNFNKTSNYLDVMSLADVFKITRDCWTDIFEKYFKNDLYSNWEYKFKKCSKARNPVAHGHEEYLSELEKNEVDTYCKQIVDSIKDSNIIYNSVVDTNRIIETARNYKGISCKNEKKEKPVEQLIGKTVVCHITKIGGQNKNNLQGIIEDKYQATISAKYLTDVNLNRYINLNVKAIVESIDHQSSRYILKLTASIDELSEDVLM